MRSVFVPLVLGLIGGVVVEVSTRICCGGVYGALEIGGVLASYSLRLRMDSRSFSRLCKNGCLPQRFVPFEHSLCMFRMDVRRMLPLVLRWCGMPGVEVVNGVVMGADLCCDVFVGLAVVGLRM